MRKGNKYIILGYKICISVSSLQDKSREVVNHAGVKGRCACVYPYELEEEYRKRVSLNKGITSVSSETTGR